MGYFAVPREPGSEHIIRLFLGLKQDSGATAVTGNFEDPFPNARSFGGPYYWDGDQFVLIKDQGDTKKELVLRLTAQPSGTNEAAVPEKRDGSKAR